MRRFLNGRFSLVRLGPAKQIGVVVEFEPGDGVFRKHFTVTVSAWSYSLIIWLARGDIKESEGASETSTTE